MIVRCDSTDCIFNKDRHCDNNIISLCDLECEDYENILDTDEYQEVYYTSNKRREGKDNIPDEYFRLEKKGKKVEWNGYTFFTGEDIRDGLYGRWFTEKRTGYGLSLYTIKTSGDEFEKFQRVLKEAPDVMTLPLYEYKPGEGYVKVPEGKP